MKKKQTSSNFVTRFAPSPTGGLHVGHAYSALTAWRMCQQQGGRFLLRMEDIDVARCREEYVEDIYADLAWLDIKWEMPVRCQSEHFEDYQQALDRLKAMGFVYPCFCTRAEIKAEITRSPSAPHGPDGALYPGTCRHLGADKAASKAADGFAHAWRINVGAAQEYLQSDGRWPLVWHDELKGDQIAEPASLGDVVLARKDTPTSYHLAVTVDDNLQGISHVIRGEDLFHATHIHRLLQALLDLRVPKYHHHALLLDEMGKRFAKRDKALTIKAIRSRGGTVSEMINQYMFFGEREALSE